MSKQMSLFFLLHCKTTCTHKQISLNFHCILGFLYFIITSINWKLIFILINQSFLSPCSISFIITIDFNDIMIGFPLMVDHHQPMNVKLFFRCYLSLLCLFVLQAYYSYSWTTFIAQFGGWTGLLLGIRQTAIF
jgi:hypothetical protein